MGHAPLLYDELSAMENLRYFAGLYGLHDERICKDAMSMVGLDPELSRRAGQYSQGMRQRLSLARAVLHDPELILLDEPFSNVDAHSAREMAAVLGRVRDRGKTIFVVTHQAALMEGIADEFVHMTAGQIDAREEMARAGDTASSHVRDDVMTTFTMTRATLLKDLRMEWRSKDAINSMLFFALLVVVIFSFAFNPTAEESRRIAGGLVWVAFLFAAVVALNQTWARELRNQVLDAYRVSPAPPNALFLAKAVGNFLFVVVLEALMAPLFVVFYELRSVGPLWQLVVVALLGTWALVVNGTFFAALSIRTRSREIMLPLILFPISIPALLGMVDATTAILTGESSPDFLDQDAGGLRCGVYGRVSAAIRNGVERGMNIQRIVDSGWSLFHDLLCNRARLQTCRKRPASELGFSPWSQGLKPLSWSTPAARLKSCPDTNLLSKRALSDYGILDRFSF